MAPGKPVGDPTLEELDRLVGQEEKESLELPSAEMIKFSDFF